MNMNGQNLVESTEARRETKGPVCLLVYERVMTDLERLLGETDKIHRTSDERTRHRSKYKCRANAYG